MTVGYLNECGELLIKGKFQTQAKKHLGMLCVEQARAKSLLIISVHHFLNEQVRFS